MTSLPASFIDQIVGGLSSLYTQYGYAQYKMSKFEEYDLYARNKDFLIGDHVITFTDTTGKLMALKPDVTLSIVKNNKGNPDTLKKLYYHENVYRVSKGSRSFEEIMQVGLECIGPVDDYCICEVLDLAAQSLRMIENTSILEVSHLGILTSLFKSIGIPGTDIPEAFRLIGEKNAHELSAFCHDLGVSEQYVAILEALIFTSGSPTEVLPKIRKMLGDLVESAQIDSFEKILSTVNDPMVHVDFSVVDNTQYYNGVVFKGFVPGIPSGVLSGGQYDRLMVKMGEKNRAIGFAVYMDLLERLDNIQNDYDVDIILLYNNTDSFDVIRNIAKQLISEGYSVMTQPSVPEKIRCRTLMSIKNGQPEVIAEYA